jgi:uncharacterized protein with HEPN domain
VPTQFQSSPLPYFRINKEIVWETVEKHLPALKEEIEKVLGQLPSE